MSKIEKVTKTLNILLLIVLVLLLSGYSGLWVKLPPATSFALSYLFEFWVVVTILLSIITFTLCLLALSRKKTSFLNWCILFIDVVIIGFLVFALLSNI